MQKINYYCDKCRKEVNKEDIQIKKIPTLERIEAKGGKGNPQPILAMYSALTMKESELCKDCADIYNVLWNYHMGLIAQQWIEISELK